MTTIKNEEGTKIDQLVERFLGIMREEKLTLEEKDDLVVLFSERVSEEVVIC